MLRSRELRCARYHACRRWSLAVHVAHCTSTLMRSCARMRSLHAAGEHIPTLVRTNRYTHHHVYVLCTVRNGLDVVLYGHF